jgi:hypothetical protein
MSSRVARAALGTCLGLSLSWILIAPAPARAARRGAVERTPTAEERAERQQRVAEAEKAVAELIQRSAVRPVEESAIAADAHRIVTAMTDEQVRDLLGGKELSVALPSHQRVVQVAGGRLQTIVAKAIGDSTSDLVFVPVQPCRIIDTRLAGGALAPGSERDFQVTGTASLAAQGGNASGCGIPQGASTPTAAAVAINFIAVGPAGPGDLRAWAFGQTKPLASIINYAAVSGLNIANGVVVPIAGTAADAADLAVIADVSGTHLVADVTGYFTRFPTEQLQASVKPTLTLSDANTLIDMSSGSCINLNSCTVASGGSAGTVVVNSYSQFVANHVAGTTDRVAVGVDTTSAACTWTDGTPDSSGWSAPGAIGTNPDYDSTVYNAKTFHQAANTSVTYYLDGKWLAGNDTGDKNENSRLICIFYPD